MARTVVVVRPQRGFRGLRLREIWRSRELIGLLAWRDVTVRYKQALLGIAWAALQPLLMTVVFTLFVTRLGHVDTGNLPYVVFALAGIVAWTFFANSVSAASQSLVTSAPMLTRVYFPRLNVPLAAIVAWLPDLALATVAVVVVMAIKGVTLSWTAVFLPLVVAWLLLAAASVSVWLAPISVAYRDVRYATPFLVQVWMFATPVVYPRGVLSEQTARVLRLNPLTPAIETFRWALTGEARPPTADIVTSVVTITAIFLLGLVYFRRVEEQFADLV